jgi:hypothetical protein
LSVRAALQLENEPRNVGVVAQKVVVLVDAHGVAQQLPVFVNFEGA